MGAVGVRSTASSSPTLTIPGDDARRKTARYGAWLDAFGQGGKQDDADGFTGYDFQSAGGTIGLDYLFGEKFLAGVSVGMSGTNVDLNSNQGDSNIKGVFGYLYGSYFTRHLYLDMALSYGGQSFDSQRNYTVGSLSGTASSDHNGDLFSGYVEGGYNFEKRNWILQPYAALQYIYLSEDAFNESGTGPLNLSVSSHETGSLVSELGLRLNYVIPVANGNFLPEVAVAWNYDFGIDDRLVTASFAGAPGTSFSVKGEEAESNGLVVGAGVTFMSRNGFSSSLKYRGDFRSDFQSHSIIGELLRYEF